MIRIEFPQGLCKVKMQDGKAVVWDGIRKKWLRLTEEESVRQQLVQYFIQMMHYPSALIALEKSFVVNGLQKRFDILIYDAAHQPWMLVECKAPQIALTEATFAQLLRYHISIPVPYLIISNGHQTWGWQKAHAVLKNLDALPQWPLSN